MDLVLHKVGIIDMAILDLLILSAYLSTTLLQDASTPKRFKYKKGDFKGLLKKLDAKATWFQQSRTNEATINIVSR